MSDRPYISLGEVQSQWWEEIVSGVPPKRYKVGTQGLANIIVGPKRIVMVGGPPGMGKSALVMQLGFDALGFDETLKMVVCNVEMTADELLTRELSRRSAVELSAIQWRRLDDEQKEKVVKANEYMSKLRDRVFFIQPPFTLERATAALIETDSQLLIVDYIQRIIPDDDFKAKDPRQQNTEVMGWLRRIANKYEKAIIVVSSVSRGKGIQAYANPDLGSYKESGDLEYGADDCYALQPCDMNNPDGRFKLKHLKARNSERKDIDLLFAPKFQRFTTDDKGTK